MSTTFAEMLRYLRKQHGVSQNLVSERTTYDKSFISRLESQERKPTREAILRIAEAIELSDDETDQLLLMASFMPVQATSMLNNPELARLDDLITMAPADKQEWAKDSVKDLIAVLSIRKAGHATPS